MSEGPHEIDCHVGRRIRQFRRAAGMTQERLAQAITVSFQQVQKYERGANRISASKLYQVATALEIDVADLFAGLDETAAPAFSLPGGVAEPHEGRNFAALLERVRSAHARVAVIDVVEALLRIQSNDAVEHEDDPVDVAPFRRSASA